MTKTQNNQNNIIPENKDNIEISLSEKEILASNIAFFRKKMNLSQTELADLLQYSNKNISKWEQAETTPDIFTLKKLADIFGVSIDTLLSPLSNENKDAIKSKNAVPFRWKLYMLLLANAIFFLCVCVAWFVLKTVNCENFSANLLFIYMLPVIDTSVFIFICCVRKKVDIISLSLFGWLMVVCFYVTFLSNPLIGYVFIIAVGWQVFAPILATLINSGKIIKFNKLILKIATNKKSEKQKEK